MAPENSDIPKGGPDPDGALSSSQKDFIKLCISLIILGLFSIRLGSLLDLAWTSGGFARKLIYNISSGFNIDYMILFPFGVTSAWVFLFIIDKTKRLQRWLVVISFIILFAWITIIEGRWGTEMVSWKKFWFVPIIGVIFGLLTGSASQFLGIGRKREFPTAATGLFLLVSIITVSGYLDVHILTPVTATNSAISFPPTTVAGKVLDTLVVFGFVSLFGWFISYTEYQTATILASDSSLAVAILSGLLYHTRNNYSGEANIGGVALSNLFHSLESGNKPEFIDRRSGDDNYFEISYLSPSKPSIWIRIGTYPIDMSTLTEPVINQLENRLTSKSKFNLVRDLLSRLGVPNRFIKTSQSQTGLLIDNVENSDILIFVSSTDELETDKELSDTNISSISTPREFNRFKKIAQYAQNDKEIVIVITGAEKLLHLSDADSIVEASYARFLRGQILDLNANYTVVPVSWSNEIDKDEEIIGGIERIRQLIDN